MQTPINQSSVWRDERFHQKMFCSMLNMFKMCQVYLLHNKNEVVSMNRKMFDRSYYIHHGGSTSTSTLFAIKQKNSFSSKTKIEGTAQNTLDGQPIQIGIRASTYTRRGVIWTCRPGGTKEERIVVAKISSSATGFYKPNSSLLQVAANVDIAMVVCLCLAFEHAADAADAAERNRVANGHGPGFGAGRGYGHAHRHGSHHTAHAHHAHAHHGQGHHGQVGIGSQW
jgi:hypothetical protein